MASRILGNEAGGGINQEAKVERLRKRERKRERESNS